LNRRRAPGPGFSGLRGGLRQIEILSAFCELSRLCGRENFRLGRAVVALPSWPVTTDHLDHGIDRQIGPARLPRPAGRKRIDLKATQRILPFGKTYWGRIIDCVFTRTFLPQLHADLPLRDAIKASQVQSHARGSRRPRSAPGPITTRCWARFVFRPPARLPASRRDAAEGQNWRELKSLEKAVAVAIGDAEPTA
jgi:hypothetical protein